MSDIKISCLASGSNGNAVYIENHDSALLIDCGISRREMLRRLRELSIDISRIRALVITHEHLDHIRSADQIATEFNLPVYLSRGTRLAAIEQNILTGCKMESFRAGETFRIGDFDISTFRTSHDTLEPCGIVVNYRGVKTGVFTDLGSIDKEISARFSELDACILETNYDHKLLWDSPRPVWLKQRICGGIGHISNNEAGELFNASAQKIRLLFLAHLSGECNTRRIAYDTFMNISAERVKTLATRIVVTKRDQCTAIFPLE